MKQTLLSILLMLLPMVASAETVNIYYPEYEDNLFDLEDVDSDGWLWLNTTEKIAKYVGNCNETNYTVDPNGKPIQMAFANITPDYPETVADPDVVGTDKAGYVAGQEADGYVASEAIKGAIVIAGASAQMSTNGGCLILNLPSCSTISLMLSSEGSMLGRTLMLTPGYGIDNDDSTGDLAWTGHTKAIYSKATLFGKLHGPGQFKWEGIESLNNGNNDGVTFKSDAPVYFAFQNCHKYPIYVHAIKVTIPRKKPGVITGSTGIATFCSDKDLDFSTVAGLKAYIGAGFNRETGVMTMLQVTDVPAGTGLLLKGSKGSYDIPEKASSSIYANLLVGVNEAVELSQTADGKTNYVLAEGANGTGFYIINETGTLAAGKAYLSIPTATAYSRQAITLEFQDEEATGISDNRSSASDATWYDLQGRRIAKPTKPGLYIRNGQKITVR